MEIGGSYRRGLPESSDIDILITTDKKQQKFMSKIVDNLKKDKILIEAPSLGPSKMMGIVKLPTSDVYRRLDILYVQPDEWGPALLHSTGSGAFNKQMRFEASMKGFKLSEKGLFKLNDEGKPEEKINATDEKDIFAAIEKDYIEPKDRDF